MGSSWRVSDPASSLIGGAKIDLARRVWRTHIHSMLTVDSATELRLLLKRYLDAQTASTRAQDARHRLQPGSTRARVTTANANWANAAEHRDRCAAAVEAHMHTVLTAGITT